MLTEQLTLDDEPISKAARDKRARVVLGLFASGLRLTPEEVSDRLEWDLFYARPGVSKLHGEALIYETGVKRPGRKKPSHEYAITPRGMDTWRLLNG